MNHILEMNVKNLSLSGDTRDCNVPSHFHEYDFVSLLEWSWLSNMKIYHCEFKE